MAKPRGKYASVIGTLPRLINTDGSQQDRVEALKKVLAQDDELDSTTAYAKAYQDARQRKEAVEALLKSVEDEIEALTQMMADRFENEGLTGMKLDDGANVSIHYEPYAQVVDKESFRLWCIKNGLERSLQLAWQTTNSLTKEMLVDGKPEPDGVTCFSRLKLRYAKGNSESEE